MNTMNDLYRGARGLSASDCETLPPRCSTCGSLQCLCRPRFFAGQVLAADDLNRLDAYIRGKHRLHNRQLHGWGVVNGLEVTCNPCGDGVAVGCGYALSPCGDDIVVCESVAVDICALIERCRQDERPWDACAPLKHARPGPCPQGDEEWILTIRYAESPARGVKPLRAGQGWQNRGGCACGAGGGSGSGGASSSGKSCSCGGAAPRAKATAAGASCRCGAGRGSRSCSCGGAVPRGAPAACEPTVICEGYAFDVVRKPASDPGADDDLLNLDSELGQRFACCMEMLTRLPKMPGKLSGQDMMANTGAWRAWSAAAIPALQRYFARAGSTNCELQQRLALIVLPGANATPVQVAIVAVQLVLIWFDALLQCLCSALLPPCPQPTQDERVPLAVLHVDAASCKVLRVCNWSVHRKLAVTMPALQYWLDLLPFSNGLREMLQALCCFDLGALLPERDVPPPPSVVAPAPGGGIGAAVPVAGAQPAAAATQPGAAPDPEWQHLQRLLQAGNGRLQPQLASQRNASQGLEMLVAAFARSKNGLGLDGVANGLLGGSDQDAMALSAGERANLPQALLLAQAAFAARQAVQDVNPLAVLTQGLAATMPSRAEAASETAQLRAELDELRAQVRLLQPPPVRPRAAAKTAKPANAGKPTEGGSK
jgi:hypothetical protein